VSYFNWFTPRTRILLEKLIFAHVAKNLPISYGIRQSCAVFTTGLYLCQLTVKIRFQVFCVVMSCNVAVGYTRFGGLFCLHLQDVNGDKKGGLDIGGCYKSAVSVEPSPHNPTISIIHFNTTLPYSLCISPNGIFLLSFPLCGCAMSPSVYMFRSSHTPWFYYLYLNII